MNKFIKNILAGFFAFALFSSMAVAQTEAGSELPTSTGCCAYGAPACPDSLIAQDCPMSMHRKCTPMEFNLDKVVYTDFGFVYVNEPDNAIDLIVRKGDTMCRAGRFVVDQHKGRHDIKAVLRPVGIKIVGPYIVFLASAQDSAYIGVLDHSQCSCKIVGKTDSMKMLAHVGFSAHADGFNICPAKHELIVVGFNPAGYTADVIDLSNGIHNISSESLCSSYSYHIPKQSERIKMSDPYGVGLTCVAVLVVFFALICIAIILKAFGKAIVKFQQRDADKAAAKTGAAPVVATETAGDVYAAIAAALYMYDEELHDEEDTVLTIQKVERAWTPWNAKFYNMNHYFNNRKQ